MKPFSPHSNFFSSLKQVEKRLKLEDSSSSPSSPSQPQETNLTSESSLSTPLYLNFDQSIKNTSTHQDSSDETPFPFLSSFPQKFLQTRQDPPSQINTLDHENPIAELKDDAVEVEFDDIEQLMQLLGLSDCGGDENEIGGDMCLKSGYCGESCNCESGFYEKIVGVKGPKCAKEVARLNGWIKHFANDGGGEERIEPLRLAHLLLGKANLDDCGGFAGIEFPSTIEDFLKYDPPVG